MKPNKTLKLHNFVRTARLAPTKNPPTVSIWKSKIRMKGKKIISGALISFQLDNVSFVFN